MTVKHINVEGTDRAAVEMKEMEAKVREIMATAPENVQFVTGSGTPFPQKWLDQIEEGENLDKVERISGTQIAGNPYEAVQQVVEILRNTYIEPHMLKDFVTFEQTIVATFVRQLHLMVEKQRGYGTKNIAMLEAIGILRRIEEKVLRGYEEIGDPKTQVERLKELRAALPDDPSATEMAVFIRQEEEILFPGGSNEDTIDNLALDIANLGEILYVEMNGAWGHPLEERLPADVKVLPE